MSTLSSKDKTNLIDKIFKDNDKELEEVNDAQVYDMGNIKIIRNAINEILMKFIAPNDSQRHDEDGKSESE